MPRPRRRQPQRHSGRGAVVRLRGDTLPAVASTEPSPFPTAAAAQVYLCRRRHLLGCLERIERELRRRDVWETNALLPAELQRPAARPALHREGLDGLQRLRTEERSRLDGERPEGRCARAQDSAQSTYAPPASAKAPPRSRTGTSRRSPRRR